MSKNFEKVNYYYIKKYWDKDRVHKSVGKWITEEEYKKITKEDYL